MDHHVNRSILRMVGLFKFFPKFPVAYVRITIKSRRMRWAGHVARMGEKRNAYRILVGKPEEGDH
jgi:hypothetical protein